MKTALIIALCFVILLAAAAIFFFAFFGSQFAAIKSIKRIGKGDSPLYYMEYSGDYGFDRFLEQGGATSADAVASYLTEFLSHGLVKHDIVETDYACSVLSAGGGESDAVFGRNFDWDYCDTIIIRTKPKKGYASISTCNMNFIAKDKRLDPTKDIASGMLAIAGIYVPLDGINEKGLAVADLVICDLPETETHQHRGKTPLTTTTAIRLLLDKAATVDEAVALLEQYDMNSDIDMIHHLSIADATGRNVVVEYFGGEMYVTETPVVTNFVVAEHEYKGMGSGTSHERFDKLLAAREAASDMMSEPEVLHAMESVKEVTAWTIVMNQKKLTYDLYFRGDFSTPYSFSLVADPQ